MKILDKSGVSYLFKKLSLQDYPNNETLISVLNAIDQEKQDVITDTIILTDTITGEKHKIQIQNGQLVSFPISEEG